MLEQDFSLEDIWGTEDTKEPGTEHSSTKNTNNIQPNSTCSINTKKCTKCEQGINCEIIDKNDKKIFYFKS